MSERSDTGKIKLMSHLVAGYPTDDIALLVAQSLLKGGADILEIQLPFSDPSADGPAIQEACTQVLSRGYKTSDGLAFIERVKNEFPKTPIYIMSYGSLIYTPGVEAFCLKAASCGVNGMIIPDFPFDHDEGLTASCIKNGMENIPVAAPSMADERLKKLSSAGFTHIYAALRTGITGSKTVISDSTLTFLKRLSEGGSSVYGGFGISNGEQSAALASSVEAVVAGSVFVRLIAQFIGTPNLLAEKIEAKAREITHS